MFNSTLKWALLSVHLLVAGLPLNGFSKTNQCALLFKATVQRGVIEPTIEWNNDISYLETLQRKESLGQVGTFFSEKWDTQIYYTQTALPDGHGKVPLVDPESKAVFIFFHGSGTKNSGGRNFIANMNTLANMGYSAISMDMPFHGEGPIKEEFNKSPYFMEWARSIILEAKKSGKPVYLAGHSFGPDVILELATRYPKMIDGVTALSPAGFTKELSKWYDNYTTKMNFGGNVESNDDGGLWAGTMSKQFIWHKAKLTDPTVINPKLNIRILSGNKEEYVPAPIGGENHTPIGENTYDISEPLQKIFKAATITIEPGIGHYIFDHTDANGINVVTRELLLTAGENPSNTKKLIESTKAQNSLLHPSSQLGKKYIQDPLFKFWVDANYGKGKAILIHRNSQDSIASKILKEFEIAQESREKEIHMKILNSQTEFPDFYNKYKNYIEGLKPNKVDRSLFNPYLILSKKNSLI
ncbi:MAG: alpha/beta fold hydrolase [Pseudobdellovibrio sp.]